MRLAICLKEVPDTEARLRVSKDGRWIDDEDLRYVINESDLHALEEGLKITETQGGEVIVFSLGPERAKESLRKALSYGAERAVHLADPAFSGGDAIATARALAAAIRRENVDLVLTGSQSDDVGYGSTASMLAGFLGWPQAWLVMGVELEPESGSAKIKREMESGMNEIFRLKLPAVIEVQAGINHPRYPTLKGIMAAKRKAIDSPSPSDLGLDPGQVGSAGSKLEVLSVAFPETSKGAEILQGDAATATKALVDRLQKEARVL